MTPPRCRERRWQSTSQKKTLAAGFKPAARAAQRHVTRSVARRLALGDTPVASQSTSTTNDSSYLWGCPAAGRLQKLPCRQKANPHGPSLGGSSTLV
jgi:hypothetical protein